MRHSSCSFWRILGRISPAEHQLAAWQAARLPTERCATTARIQNAQWTRNFCKRSVLGPPGRLKMSTMCETGAIYVGVVAGEPIRLEGLTSVFEREPEFGQSQLLPVIGTLEELLADEELEYLIIDLNSSVRGIEMLKEIRRQRPSLRLIVIGPSANDALVMDSIIAGARAYLDLTAGPRVVREAIEVVVSG